MNSDQLINVLSNLSAAEIYSKCRISKQFYTACNNPLLWKIKLQQDFGITDNVNPMQTYRQKYDNVLDSIVTNEQSNINYYGLVNLRDLPLKYTRVSGIQPNVYLMRLS